MYSASLVNCVTLRKENNRQQHFLNHLIASHMRIIHKIILLNLAIFVCFNGKAQADKFLTNLDSSNQRVIAQYKQRIVETEKQRIADSVKRTELMNSLKSLQLSETYKKEKLQKQLLEISNRDSQRIVQKRVRIDSLRQIRKGNPVIGLLNDTLFYIYERFGTSTSAERAGHVSGRIRSLYNNDFLNVDSIKNVESENAIDIVYDETIIMSVSETDALWNNMQIDDLAKDYNTKIKAAILHAKQEYSVEKTATKGGLIVLIIAVTCLLIWLIGKGYARLLRTIQDKKDAWFKDFVHKDYTYLTAKQMMNIILFLIKIFRWIIVAVMLYAILTILFSILVFTRGWAVNLFNLVWLPFRGILVSIWHYMPNLFSILVIYFVISYFNKLVKYIFSEIQEEKLKISGFQADWAMPTFRIVNFLSYAFMFVLIFPYLPGSDSNIFKGVSVFIGIIFSFGSSSAIANIISGLVITYMSPFKIGDRIKIGEITGDVVEKSLLVTRLKTPKNEEVTLPNSAMLSGNIINYSSHARSKGLIIHTTVTIGYDTAWKDIHQALIDAALRIKDVKKEPEPFVLQTALNDFYVSYQINAYTDAVNTQERVYSQLHQNIQDVCNERGIEILSPHYHYQRDGNMTTIPTEYLKDDYQPPVFNVYFKKDSDK